MRKKRQLYLFLLLFLFLIMPAIYFGTKIAAQSCSDPSCTVKEIGMYDVTFNRFTPNSSLELNEDYWVRLKVNGSGGSTAGTYAGADIVVAMDLTTSMENTIPPSQGRSSTVIKAHVAHELANRFIYSSDQTKDYIALGSFTYCDDPYSPLPYSVVWPFTLHIPQRTNAKNASILHTNLLPLSTSRTTLVNLINTMVDRSETDPDDVIQRSCPSVGYANPPAPYENGGTSIGSAITLGNAVFSNVLSDPRAVRRDGTRYSVDASTGPRFRRPLYTGNESRSAKGNPSITKHVVVISDGGESVPPLVRENSLQGDGTSIVETAVANNIRVHSLVVGNSQDGRETLEYVSGATGGILYYIPYYDQVPNAFTTIRNSITASTAPAPEVIIEERINATNFAIKELTSTGSYPSLIVKKNSGGNEITLSDTICRDADSNGIPDCVVNIIRENGVIIGFDIDVGILNANEYVYVYFQTTPTTPGTNIPVDKVDSRVEYRTGNSSYTTLDNTNVTIAEAPAYFTVGQGNIYSHSLDADSVVSSLPENSYFIEIPQGIAFTRGSFTSLYPQISEPKMTLSGYSMRYDYTYDVMFNRYKDKLITQNAANWSQVSTSGVYQHKNITAPHDLRLNSTWSNRTIQNSLITVFVEGDLYITENLRVDDNGKSALAFIVRGNIGISPSVTTVEAILMADGVIDTACEPSSGFTNETCAPTSSTVSQNLTIEGMVHAQRGMLLDRSGGDTELKSETFSLRPDFLVAMSPTLGSSIIRWLEVTN